MRVVTLKKISSIIVFFHIRVTETFRLKVKRAEITRWKPKNTLLEVCRIYRFLWKKKKKKTPFTVLRRIEMSIENSQ